MDKWHNWYINNIVVMPICTVSFYIFTSCEVKSKIHQNGLWIRFIYALWESIHFSQNLHNIFFTSNTKVKSCPKLIMFNKLVFTGYIVTDIPITIQNVSYNLHLFPIMKCYFKFLCIFFLFYY